MRGEHRNIASSVEFVVSETRGLSGAVKRLDLARINQFDRRVTNGLRRFDRMGSYEISPSGQPRRYSTTCDEELRPLAASA